MYYIRNDIFAFPIERAIIGAVTFLCFRACYRVALIVANLENKQVKIDGCRDQYRSTTRSERCPLRTLMSFAQPPQG